MRKHSLTLYVTGSGPHSLRAAENLSRFCEDHLQGAYELEIVDILEHPELAELDNILAAPTLVRREPPPARKIVGDLRDPDQVIRALELGTPSSPARHGKHEENQER